MTFKQFFYIGVATLITVLIWVAMEVLISRDQIQPPAEIQQLLEPLDPSFDQAAIDEL